ncbi:MAG: hypothetical protein EOM25_14180, partial [Deltaproteobacteria bacterium]|nr:hypothetical protein [Deltaproteobacteria bacterium]
MPRHFFKDLRKSVTGVGLCCLLAVMLVSAPWAIRAGNATAGMAMERFSDQAEDLTRQRLEAVKERLKTSLAVSPAQDGDDLRAWLIRASMWGPLAGMSSKVLELLGDSETARKALFFLMPLVRWMSEPFLFPVETAGSEEKCRAEMERLFGFIIGQGTKSRKVSLDNVGDAARSEADVKAYRDYYRETIIQFARDGGMTDLSLSLKLSALTLDLSAAVGQGESARAKRMEIEAAVGDLLLAAREVRQSQRLMLRLDMEEYVFKDFTLDLFRTIVEKHPELARNADGSLRLGVVIQAYLRDSARDVRELAAWGRANGLRVPIRLVKGAYLEHERALAADEKRPSPVWDHKPSTDANYETLSACLLLNRDALQPAFATHNIRSMARVMALAEMLAISPAEVEFQMLYGMGDPIKPVLTGMGYGLREYVPAGSLARGLKYAGRRFQELAGADNALARTMR